MELRRWHFALCGSSARKLRRGGANLSAGRALTLSLESFSGAELGKEFDQDFALEWGLLPFVRNEPEDDADSYRFGAIQVFPVKDFVRALFSGEVF